MAAISIHALDQAHLDDFNRCDGEFKIDSRLRLRFIENRFEYDIIPESPRLKRYPSENLNPQDYIDSSHQAVYLAYFENNLAGQIILRTNWNHFGYIQDLVVDQAFRRRGIGRALLGRAKTWAAERDLPGLMLETQDVNVPACRLYQSYGFTLSGFDQYLYRGLDPSTTEVALYWYLIFPAPQGS